MYTGLQPTESHTVTNRLDRTSSFTECCSIDTESTVTNGFRRIMQIQYSKVTVSLARDAERDSGKFRIALSLGSLHDGPCLGPSLSSLTFTAICRRCCWCPDLTVLKINVLSGVNSNPRDL